MQYSFVGMGFMFGVNLLIGDNWENAKIQAECYDYLFRIAVKMKKLGIDPAEVPLDSEYAHLSK